MRRGPRQEFLPGFRQGDVQAFLTWAMPARRYCRPSVVLPDPGLPSTRYSRCGINPPFRMSSNPGILVRDRFVGRSAPALFTRPSLARNLGARAILGRSPAFSKRHAPAQPLRPSPPRKVVGRAAQLARLSQSVAAPISSENDFRQFVRLRSNSFSTIPGNHGQASSSPHERTPSRHSLSAKFSISAHLPHRLC